MNTKQRENRARRELGKDGFMLRKSRRPFSGDNLGGFMIVDANMNAVVAGERFDLTLDEVEAFILEKGE